MSVQEECHVNEKAEIGVVHSQTKECQRLSENHQKLGRGLEQIHPHKAQRANPANTFISDFSSPELGDSDFCYLNPGL